MCEFPICWGLQVLPGMLSWGRPWGKCMCLKVGLGALAWSSVGWEAGTLSWCMSWGTCMCSLKVGLGLGQVLGGVCRGVWLVWWIVACVL